MWGCPLDTESPTPMTIPQWYLAHRVQWVRLDHPWCPKGLFSSPFVWPAWSLGRPPSGHGVNTPMAQRSFLSLPVWNFLSPLSMSNPSPRHLASVLVLGEATLRSWGKHIHKHIFPLYSFCWWGLSLLVLYLEHLSSVMRFLTCQWAKAVPPPPDFLLLLDSLNWRETFFISTTYS